MSNTTAISSPTHTLLAPPADPFEGRYGCSLPAGLGAEASGMAWPEFVETFGGDCGEVALERWSTARGTIPGTFTYDAELVVAGRRRSFQVVDTGPIAALTAMLYETGRGVEILSFHQRAVADGTATFMHCERDGRRRWATAIADSTTDSALSALIVAANLLTNSNSATRAIWGKPAPPV